MTLGFEDQLFALDVILILSRTKFILPQRRRKMLINDHTRNERMTIFQAKHNDRNLRIKRFLNEHVLT